MPRNGESARNFSVTITPASVSPGAAILHVTVQETQRRENQQLGSAEIYVPSGFTIQSVSNFSNANWMGGVSGQTVRVGAVGGNQKLDGNAGRISVTFDINVTSTECGTYPFATAKASNAPYSDPFESNWTYTGSALSVTVTGCVPSRTRTAKRPLPSRMCTSIASTSPAVAEMIISSVAHHMTQGARFDGIDQCDVEAYRAAVIAFVDALLKG